MKKILIPTLFFLLILSNQSFCQYDFDLNDVDGNSIKLSELVKKGPVFIQFWAMWCVPCKEEMRIMNELYGKYKDSGFVYVAINQDSPKSSTKVKSYVQSKGFQFITLLDGDMSVFERFGGQNLPFAIFMGRDGNIIKTYTAYIMGDEVKLEDDIKNALKPGKN